jgi:vitamin B12 transporter
MPLDAAPAIEVVVTSPARLPEAAGDPAFSIVKLTDSQLRSSPRLDEILETVPGLSLFRRNSSLGANPTTQGVSLRGIAGSASSRALVSLDGVPQNDPFGGWVIWSGLAPDRVQAVTVVRGAGAGPYGAGALTGSIDLAARAAAPGGLMADGSVGSLNDRQGAALASARLGAADLVISAAGESSGGYIPVRAGRGAADQRLTLNDWSGATGVSTDLGVGTLSARASGYQEDRGSGLIGAESRARGGQASLTLTRAPTASSLGYRLQAWVASSDLLNTSVSVAAGRATTTPANDQYATPAIGYGLNAAVRRAVGGDTLELGADLRGASGESRELFKYATGAFTRTRRAGGETLTGGLYVEATHADGPWLWAGGARLDGWRAYDAHRIEASATTGVVTLNQHTPDQGGARPTARLALRRDLGAGLYARAASYAGFRPATLNELNRPFRVGHDITEANPALRPERLIGGELGVGGAGEGWSWDATVFLNRLTDAVVNVTLHTGPYADPVEGFIPAGGTLYQRRNVDHIDAAGVEAEARRRWGSIDFTLAAGYTAARVDGGAAAPQLTGRQPAETPRLTTTASAEWRATDRLRLTAEVRYETKRYDDDLNTRPLGDGAVVNARAEWRIRQGLGIFVAGDNLFDAALQTGRTAASGAVPGVVSYGPPRMVRVGLTFRR